ncbi:MAG: sulfur carrier protein ThiS [Bacteroidota bacterium]
MTDTRPEVLLVNGEAEALPASGQLTDVLSAHGVAPETARGVAVALNDTVIRRADWSATTVQVGDRIEVITATQGG